MIINKISCLDLVNNLMNLKILINKMDKMGFNTIDSVRKIERIRIRVLKLKQK